MLSRPRTILLLALLLPVQLLAQTLDYSEMDNWVSHPERALDVQKVPLTFDLVGPDTTQLTRFELDNPTENTGVDIFYIYPTQDPNFSFTPTNLDNRTLNPEQVRSTFLAQSGIFGTFGRQFAPFYRQVNLAAFANYDSLEQQRELMEFAYADVEAAFEYYLDNYNNGNQIVIVSHSQGSQMAQMLLRRKFDTNPQLRDQLLAALLGGLGYYYTPADAFTGGSLANIPLCGDSAQCGCIHSWRSYKRGVQIPNPNLDAAAFNALLAPDYHLNTYDTTQYIARQDSLIYDETPQPLTRFMRPANGLYGSDAFAIVHDSMYNASYLRESDLRIGLMIERRNIPGDQRRDYLVDEVEPTLGFNIQGYHSADFFIYGWDAMKLVQAKLDGGCTTVSRPDVATQTAPRLWYVARTHTLHFEGIRTGAPVRVLALSGRVVHTAHVPTSGTLVLPPLSAGVYVVQTGGVSVRVVR